MLQLNTQVHLIIAIFIACTQAQVVPPSLCPPNSHGNIQSASITLSSSTIGSNAIGNIQSQVYNYSLVTPFLSNPNIIIGISSFQSITSPYLMISIKPLPVTSLSALSFLIRFYYRYTNWRLLTFSYLAEDRSDIQVGYYEIDTRELATQQAGKAIQIQIPFTSNFTNMQALYFLNGFEIASIATFNNTFSPFQIQAIGISQIQQNLNFVISSTTQTQIYSLLLSYLIYDSSSTHYQSGNYQYNSVSSVSYLSLPLNTSFTPTFIFGGLNGFIVPNIQGSSQISAQLVNDTVIFMSRPALNYLTYQYFILSPIQSPCFYCQNLPYLYEGTCISACPNNTQNINNICSSCQLSQFWNGSTCINRCSGGSTWNIITQSCICPAYSNWDTSTCVFCPIGQIWLTDSLKCGCPTNQYWNSYMCTTIPACESNKIFDTISFMCACPLNSPWNGVQCANCTSGFVWDLASSSCICLSGSNYNGFQCITCSGGMLFDSINSICSCPVNTAWDGTNCVTTCTVPLILTNGQCACPAGTILTNDTCIVAPTCPQGLFWLNNQCQNITCVPGYIWNGNYCIQYVPSCPLNTYWNGLSCVGYNIQCPSGSFWNGSYCMPNSTNCPQGSYYLNGQCISFPQLCLPNYSWNGSNCLLVGISITCQVGQYFNGVGCIDGNCSNGRIWDISLVKCVCASNSFWNGAQCISCPLGQTYGASGCNCISGYFLVNGTCYNLLQIYCVLVNYAQWDGQNCVCNPGFTAVGINCICNGVIIGSSCNQCLSIPNSQFINGACQCIAGYYKQKGECIPYSSSVFNQNQTCNPGTLLDNVHNVCVPCPDGCLSCLTQSACLQCRLQYNYNWQTYLCDEICGDGRRFTLPCDDGNNNDGDGCSSDCRIEPDYTCYGGSPNSADFCSKYLPSQIVLNLTGTTHLYGSIIANIRSNYLPSNLTNPSTPCTDLCQQILQASAAGYNSYTSIQTHYLVGSAGFSFSVEIDFSAQPIGIFTLSVRINPAISQIYFPNIDSSQIYSFTINPAFLSIVQNNQQSLIN